MVTGEQFLEYLRDALNHLYEPRWLRESPLATLFGVAGRVDAPVALQRILTEAIETFEPAPDEPACSDAWQIYGPLMYRYVERLSQPQVAGQLGFSARHLRRKEHEAMEALAGLLWKQFSLDAVRDWDAEAEVTGQALGDSAAVDEELAWLRNQQCASTADLDQILPGVLDLAQRLAGRHAVQMDVTGSDGLPQVAADPVAVRQILLNLLSVAIPRAAGGRVSISSKAQRWEVELRVYCAQYPSGQKPVLNEEVSSLNVAQQLADLMSGAKLRLSVDARTFDAVLALPTVKQLPVLVIDDNADTLQLLERYTAGTRYHLIATRDPEQALGLAQQHAPRIIVLDVMMPGVDGWEVLGRLRQHLHAAHIPIVVCTILAQRELAESLGANAFIRKPITREAFLAALDRQVEQTGRVSR
jgi:CheY-like chemotaxis protein